MRLGVLGNNTQISPTCVSSEGGLWSPWARNSTPPTLYPRVLGKFVRRFSHRPLPAPACSLHIVKWRQRSRDHLRRTSGDSSKPTQPRPATSPSHQAFSCSGQWPWSFAATATHLLALRWIAWRSLPRIWPWWAKGTLHSQCVWSPATSNHQRRQLSIQQGSHRDLHALHSASIGLPCSDGSHKCWRTWGCLSRLGASLSTPGSIFHWRTCHQDESRAFSHEMLQTYLADQLIKKHTCFAVPRRIAVRRRVQLQADPCTYALLYIAHLTNGSH